MTNPINAYEECVKAGKLQDDSAQRNVIARLQALYNDITKKPSLLKTLLPFLPSPAPRSLYIWGDVGRGKSLLMDIFFSATPAQAKERIHFHAFMQEVHALSHRLRQQEKNAREPLMQGVAGEIIALFGNLICLDELQVSDVADAMILNGLFSALLQKRVTFVITSNRPPEELYLGGLQREKFMDFVQLIYDRMDVVELASPQDYRMQQIRAMQAVYIWPLSEKSTAAFNSAFELLTHHSALQKVTLEVQGRKLIVAESSGGIARFGFAELCEKPLGAADYLAIARRFHTVFLSGVPILTAEKRNEARRFVTLIDTLYDHRVKLICTAAAPPEQLYPEGIGSFEFHRTVSRLAEMQSEQYLASGHV